MNIISGNNTHGVYITGTGTNDNIVSGNIVGLNASGTAALGNSSFGINVDGGALRTVIGTNGDGSGDAAERNIISGNSRGIGVDGSTTRLTTIAGNWVGLNVAGTLGIGNNIGGGDGIALTNGTRDNRVGTNADGNSDVLERNTIVGHTFAGIALYNANTSNNVVAGNWVGLNAAGTSTLANGTGVSMDFASGGVGPKNNRIGTNADGIRDDIERNVISGNGLGVLITGNGTTGNVVAGNYVGLSTLGDVSLPNTSSGVTINGSASLNVIDKNFVGGNGGAGIVVDGTNTADNVLTGNVIGLAIDGTTIRSNQRGIQVSSGAVRTRIGTNGDGVNDAAERNVIGGSRELNIWITGSTTLDTVVAGNYVGTTVNGSAAAPNGSGWRGIDVAGGAKNTRIGTDGSNDSFNESERNIVSASSNEGLRITGTGTTGSVVAGNYFGLDSTGTVGIANGGSNIRFDSGSSGTRLGTNSDGIADVQERNVISYSAFSGVSIQDSNNNRVVGNFVGTDVTGTIDIGNRNRGINITTSSNVVVESNLISGNDTIGVALSGTTSIQIRGNLIGTTANGRGLLGNTQQGILVSNGSTLTQIGGVNSADRNIISGNVLDGIRIEGATTTGTVIEGNYIGIGSDGSTDIGNSGAGVFITGSASNIVGGTQPSARNVIAGNRTGQISLSSSNNNQIVGNTIGLDATRSVAIRISQSGNSGVA